MKSTLLFLSIIIGFVSNAAAFTTTPMPVKTEANHHIIEPEGKKTSKPSFKHIRKATEKQLGRRLTLKERLGLWLYKTQTPKELDAKKANNHAILGLVFGICSIVLFPLFSIPGFFFSQSALRQEKLQPGILEGGNKGLAKAGLILSIIGFVLALLYIAYFAFLISAFVI
jgi:Domain of unknown function (DUF4190)